MNKKSERYLEINKKLWNEKTSVHYDSDFYNNKAFIEGETSLRSIELNLLNDIHGKKILHLQCHFGQDTISMSRMGAITTGVDLSNEAISKAKALAEITEQESSFICCDIYDLPNHLNEQFDIVFTSYGTIAWLPDLDKWAQIISSFLKPGGQFVFVEFHPVVWMFSDDFDSVAYSYFNTGAIIESETGTYADNEAPIENEFVVWNHGLGEVLNALLSNGLKLSHFEEFDYSPYDCFQKTVEIAPKQFRIKHLDDKIPMVYALTAKKE